MNLPPLKLISLIGFAYSILSELLLVDGSWVCECCRRFLDLSVRKINATHLTRLSAKRCCTKSLRLFVGATGRGLSLQVGAVPVSHRMAAPDIRCRRSHLKRWLCLKVCIHLSGSHGASSGGGVVVGTLKSDKLLKIAFTQSFLFGHTWHIWM